MGEDCEDSARKTLKYFQKTSSTPLLFWILGTYSDYFPTKYAVSTSYSGHAALVKI